MAVIGLVTLIVRSPGVVFTGMFDRDEAYLAVMGDSLQRGGEMYVTFVDRKPPVVPYLYAVVREFTVDMRIVRLLCALGIFASGLVIAEIVRRLTGNRMAALMGGVLAVVGTATFMPPDAQAANFELWGLLPSSAAVLAVIWARTSTRPVWWFSAVAGAMVMLAVNVKQPYIVIAAPVLFELWRGRGPAIQRFGGAFLGAAVALVPILFVVEPESLLRWAWIDNGDYVDGGINPLRALAVGLGLTAVFALFHLPLLYGLAMGRRHRRNWDPTILIWLVTAAVMVPIGLRFFGHYYQQVVPPMAVLTGVALATASRAAWRTVIGLTVLTSAVALTVAYVHRPDLANFTALGRHLQATTEADERILVWGALPDVYVSAQRAPAGVFLHGGYLTGNWGSRATVLSTDVIGSAPFDERWRRFAADLRADLPVVIVDGSRPGTSWAAYPPERYPLGDLIAGCYVDDGTLDGLPMWRLDRNACPGGR